MFSRFFPKRGVPQPIEASMPAGERFYAIGDVHGRLDLLEQLMAMIEQDNSRRAAADTQIIFLGDLVDRGPHSAQVVEYARHYAHRHPRTRFLLGNHEEVFLKAMAGDLKALAFFTRIGGCETILSYGVTEQEYRDSDYAELLDLLRQRVPAEHLAFLRAFEDLIVAGDYAFVHAGIRPGEPLARQRTSDLRWIRDEFLKHAGTLEKIIVHGHTISEDVELASHRIGLDTGAYASGRLSAMGFEADRRWVLQTGTGAAP